MRLSFYLPSSYFSTIVGSIVIAGGLIILAQYVTAPPAPANVSIASGTNAYNDWRAALEEVQTTAPDLPAAPDKQVVAKFLQAAESPNLTDSVARSLFVNLSDASAQGLGGDIPTQDKIIAAATAKIAAVKPKKTYTQEDLHVVTDSPQSQKAYGNAVMEVLTRHTGANSGAVLLAMSRATDNADPNQLKALVSIKSEYESLTNELAVISVPKTISPLHLQILNDLGVAASYIGDMQGVFGDPLRGLQALQQYQLMLGEIGRVFISLAVQLSKNGILFSKDEPGAAWSVFTST